MSHYVSYRLFYSPQTSDAIFFDSQQQYDKYY